MAIDGKSIYKVNPDQSLAYSELKEEDLSLINQLLQEIIGYNALQLTNLAYKTEPMKALKATLGGNENLNEPLDFDLVNTLNSGK